MLNKGTFYVPSQTDTTGCASSRHFDCIVSACFGETRRGRMLTPRPISPRTKGSLTARYQHCIFATIPYYSIITTTVRGASSPIQNATSTSTISWGSSNVNSIEHRVPSGTIDCEQDHLDSLSSLMPSRVSAGAHPSNWQPTSPPAVPGRMS